MAAAEIKASFAPIPSRAIGDARLTALDLRVLAVIAVHDRFSRNGTGCTAGHGRLAALVGCHIKSLSRSIRVLAECGYIGGRRNTLIPRCHAYFVIYNEFDGQYLRAGAVPGGNEKVTFGGNETVTSAAPRGNHFVLDAAARGNQTLENGEQNHSDTSSNIFPEGENKSREAFLRNPAEAVPNDKERAVEWEPGPTVSVNLARIDREKHRMPNDTVIPVLNYLTERVGPAGDLDFSDPNFCRARRLHHELHEMLRWR